MLSKIRFYLRVARLVLRIADNLSQHPVRDLVLADLEKALSDGELEEFEWIAIGDDLGVFYTD